MPIRKIDNLNIRTQIPKRVSNKKKAERSFEKIIHGSMSDNEHKSLKDYSMTRLNQAPLDTAKRILKNPFQNFLTLINPRLNQEDIEIISNILRGDIAHQSGKTLAELNAGDINRYFSPNPQDSQ